MAQTNRIWNALTLVTHTPLSKRTPKLVEILRDPRPEEIEEIHRYIGPSPDFGAVLMEVALGCGVCDGLEHLHQVQVVLDVLLILLDVPALTPSTLQQLNRMGLMEWCAECLKDLSTLLREKGTALSSAAYGLRTEAPVFLEPDEVQVATATSDAEPPGTSLVLLRSVLRLWNLFLQYEAFSVEFGRTSALVILQSLWMASTPWRCISREVLAAILELALRVNVKLGLGIQQWTAIQPLLLSLAPEDIGIAAAYVAFVLANLPQDAEKAMLARRGLIDRGLHILLMNALTASACRVGQEDAPQAPLPFGALLQALSVLLYDDQLPGFFSDACRGMCLFFFTTCALVHSEPVYNLPPRLEDLPKHPMLGWLCEATRLLARLAGAVSYSGGALSPSITTFLSIYQDLFPIFLEKQSAGAKATGNVHARLLDALGRVQSAAHNVLRPPTPIQQTPEPPFAPSPKHQPNEVPPNSDWDTLFEELSNPSRASVRIDDEDDFLPQGMGYSATPPPGSCSPEVRQRPKKRKAKKKPKRSKDHTNNMEGEGSVNEDESGFDEDDPNSGSFGNPVSPFASSLSMPLSPPAMGPSAPPIRGATLSPEALSYAQRPTSSMGNRLSLHSAVEEDAGLSPPIRHRSKRRPPNTAPEPGPAPALGGGGEPTFEMLRPTTSHEHSTGRVRTKASLHTLSTEAHEGWHQDAEAGRASGPSTLAGRPQRQARERVPSNLASATPQVRQQQKAQPRLALPPLEEPSHARQQQQQDRSRERRNWEFDPRQPATWI